MAEPTMRTVPDATVVTGAGGWLGQALLSTLSAGESLGGHGRVRALAVDDDDAQRVRAVAPTAEVVIGDVRSLHSLEPLFAGLTGTVDVLHTAGIIHPKRVAEFEQVNHLGTRNVITSAMRANVRRIVHVSSNSPFGTNPSAGDIFRQDEPFRPYLGYGVSKMRAELAVREAVDDGADIVVVRPPWFYGPFQPLRQTTFFKMVAAGGFPLLGGGHNRRSMVYVDNLVQGVQRAQLAESVSGRGYWIADARPYAVTEIIATVQDALRAEGLTVKREGGRRAPFMIGQMAETIDRLAQRRGLYHQQIHVLGEMNKTIACDISAARTDLGYEPQIELLEGMRRSIRWCLARGVDLG